MTSNQVKPALQWAQSWLKKPKKHLINGEWYMSESSDAYTSINPTNGDPLTTIPVASEHDVNLAVEASRAAFNDKRWRGQSRKQRRQVMTKIGELVRKNQHELATLESLDNGMLWSEAYDGNLPDCSDIFDYYGSWADKLYGTKVPTEEGILNYTEWQPLGVVGLIVPWNFPLLMAMWKVAPALVAGNSIVIKPSSATSTSLIRLCELIHEHQLLPAGVLNLVLGSGKTGDALAHHDDIQKISFTGSTVVGRKLVSASAASNLKQLTLELGGKSPNIIFADAPNLQAAIDRSFDLTMSQKGEKCSEPTRLYVHESIYEKVVEQMSAKAEAVVCGDPFDDKAQQGPQCTEAHMNQILKYIEQGRKDGRITAGGCRDTKGDNAKGFFVRPTIIVDLPHDSTVVQEEIFGPVLTIHKFASEEEAIQLANDSKYGLAAGLWTADASRAHRVASQLEAGMIFVNKYGCYDFASPFGGIKQSGWGKEMAADSLKAFSQEKSIWLTL